MENVKASGADEATPMLSAMNPESEPQPGE